MDPPPGTDFNTILQQYPGSVFVGLYQGSPSLCPPAAYPTIQQPNFPGYLLLGAQEWAAQDVPAGSGVALRRFQARWTVQPGGEPVTVAGWFAAARLSDGTFQTMLIEPFGSVVTLTAAEPAALVNVDVSSAPTGLAAGQDVVAIQGRVTQERVGGRGMFVYRGEQRECMKTVIKALNKILAWDGNSGNLPPKSKLNAAPILTAFPPQPPVTALPTGIANYATAARDVVTSLKTELTNTQ